MWYNYSSTPQCQTGLDKVLMTLEHGWIIISQHWSFVRGTIGHVWAPSQRPNNADIWYLRFSRLGQACEHIFAGDLRRRWRWRGATVRQNPTLTYTLWDNNWNSWPDIIHSTLSAMSETAAHQSLVYWRTPTLWYSLGVFGSRHGYHSEKFNA